MQSSNSIPPSTPTPAPVAKEDLVRHFPPEARSAYQRFCETGDASSLDPVILAILDDFIPAASSRALADLPGNTQLMADLGFDSLAITEVVFFTEDLFGITIANEEIIQVRTLDDLRRFVRMKLAKPA